MYLRCLFIVTIVFASNLAMAQTTVPVMEPTSATDPGVKIHSPRKFFSINHNKNLRRYKGHAHITEREGQSLPKQRHRKMFRRRESDVYKRQTFATSKKGKSNRAKLKAYRKHSMARN